MERWQDQGIVLGARRHGENGAIVSLLTENNGRHAGYVRGATSSKMRGTLEPGNVVDVNWQARAESDLGTYALELAGSPVSHFMQDPLRLGALQSACALCEAALPEREGHPGLFHGFQALCAALQTEIWGPAYVMWEIALLRELGFSLDLSRCAGGEEAEDLAYVSPKTGRAVSAGKGEPYKDKLLRLPGFLGGPVYEEDEDDLVLGLAMTEHFLEHWVFAHHTQGVPEARLRFRERAGKSLSPQG